MYTNYLMKWFHTENALDIYTAYIEVWTFLAIYYDPILCALCSLLIFFGNSNPPQQFRTAFLIWGCRTNVRQLISYSQHKTPSFKKPGVRGIISLCD